MQIISTVDNLHEIPRHFQVKTRKDIMPVCRLLFSSDNAKDDFSVV